MYHNEKSKTNQKNTNNSRAVCKGAVSKASRHLRSCNNIFITLWQTRHKIPFNPYILNRLQLGAIKGSIENEQDKYQQRV